MIDDNVDISNITNNAGMLHHYGNTLTAAQFNSVFEATNNIFDDHDSTQCYCGHTLTGVQFNSVFKNINFVKLTNKFECHNTYHFNDGLNIDTLTFDTSHDCCPGGIYFIKEEEIHKWIYYSENSGLMMYMRKVIVPDDAKVYIEDDKFKADR